MAQPQKKTTSKVTPIQSSVKSLPQAPKALTHVTLAAIEDTKASAESAIKVGSETVRDFFANGAGEFQKMQEKWFAISREATENFSRSMESASHAFNDILELSKENMEAAMELSDASAEAMKTISNELFNFANDTFSENVEISKDFFSCRTVSDAFELQSKLVKSNLDSFFNQFTSLSEMTYEFVTEAAEPINERMSETTERLTRLMASAS